MAQDLEDKVDYAGLNEEQQYRLVYQAICAVAARCDGAVELDYQGFNGQDTKFGRRIASVSFEEWTPEVRQEAARISLTYKDQIVRYTDVDPAQLDVVREARGLGTIYKARDDARGYERKAKGADKIAARKVKLVDAHTINIAWVKGDPNFGALLDGVRGLPGRQYIGGGWNVPVSRKAAEWVQEMDLPVDSDAATALAKVVSEPVAEVFHVTLNGSPGMAHVVFPEGVDKTTFGRLLDGVRALPGRRYNGADKSNSVDLCPALLEFANDLGLKVHPDVLKALEGAVAHQEALHDAGSILRFVSRQARPENLPEDFVALVRKAVVR